jgi:hypothetical protein
LSPHLGNVQPARKRSSAAALNVRFLRKFERSLSMPWTAIHLGR